MTQRLKINESPHAAKGHAAATACGRIVGAARWRRSRRPATTTRSTSTPKTPT